MRQTNKRFHCAAAVSAFFVTALALMLVLPSAYAQPTWTQLFQSGQSADYYHYDNSINPPLEKSGTTTPRPPYTYGATANNTMVTPTFTRGVCPYSNRTGLFWGAGAYSPSPPPTWQPWGNPTYPGLGTATPPQYPYPPASEYNETTWGSPDTGVKGIKGDFDFTTGSVSGGTSFQELMYFTNEYCTDASSEYGYYDDLVAGTIEFYWGGLQNCSPSSSTTYCYGDYNGTDPLFTKYESASPVVITGLGLNSHQQTHEWLYEAWIAPDSNSLYGYALTMAVVDPFDGAYAQCSLNGGTSGNCTWSGLGAQTSGFRADQLYDSSGWLIVGVAASGTPTVNHGFTVDGVYIGQ